MKPEIQSPQNPQIKQLRQLRDSAQRRQRGQFLVDGNSEIQRAIEGGFSVRSVYHISGSNALEELLRKFPNVPCQSVSSAVMSKLAYGDRSDDLVALVDTPSLELFRIQLIDPALVLVLDRVEKPGNMGACLRTAAATGVSAVVLINPICDVFNPNVIRASRGCVFRVPIAVSDLGAFADWSQQNKLRLFAGRVEAGHTLWNLDLKQGAAFIFGSEAQGLGQEWQSLKCESFSIPMDSTVDSLNVSISAAIALYEAVRQRTA
jgi:RNA methyltransferase, TrmH family